MNLSNAAPTPCGGGFVADQRTATEKLLETPDQPLDSIVPNKETGN
ncbi:hypothetical protein [Thiocapsa sp. UBA6158]|jgi:hypothetical protein|nr:hypothetical protein [Thiocapsa sp. UBA6158]